MLGLVKSVLTASVLGLINSMLNVTVLGLVNSVHIFISLAQSEVDTIESGYVSLLPPSLPPSLPHSSSPLLLSFLPPFLPFLLPLLLLPTNVLGLFGCYVSNSTLSSVCYSLCLMLTQCCWYVHLCKWLLRSVFYNFTYNSVMISQVRLKFQPRVPFLLREYPINLNPVTLHSFIHIILYSIPSVLVTHEVEKTLLYLSHQHQIG